jgi:ABC-2 type transport system permease protein
VTALQNTTQPAARPGTASLATGAFLAILRRDLLVTGREFVAFIMQAFMQPLFYLFIFGVVLPKVGIASAGYGAVLLPGVVTLTVFLAAVQGVMLPLSLDLGFTREIDDRLLSPAPVSAIVIEKILFATLRGLISAIIIFPLAYLILNDEYHVRTDTIPLLIGLIVLTAIAGASLGLVMGTVVPAEQIALVFAVLFTPMLFTGCLQYAWHDLHVLRPFQIITLFDPLTYSAEGLRHAMIPDLANGQAVSTLPIGWALAGLIGFCALFFALGIRSFRARAIR